MRSYTAFHRTGKTNTRAVCTSKPTIIKALKELVESGYIFRREEFINGVQFNRYKVNLPLLKNFNGGSKEISTGAVKDFNGGGKEILPNNKSHNNSLENKEIYKNIIAHLNEKAGTAYRSSSKATQGHINARLADGFTEQDFYTVIDKKCAEWKGTDMEKYLRPETLFGNKFENYLNAPAQQPPKGKQSKKDDTDDFMARLKAMYQPQEGGY